MAELLGPEPPVLLPDICFDEALHQREQIK